MQSVTGKMIPSEIVDAFMNLIGTSIFTVTFVKSDETERTMNCRRGVKKHLKGGVSTIKDKKDLIGVYEMNNDYRCFNKHKVKRLRGMGIKIESV